MHRFEISEGCNHTLLLVYPPESIRELASRLDAIERAHGPLPALMQVPVKGRFYNKWVCLIARIWGAVLTPAKEGFRFLFGRARLS